MTSGTIVYLTLWALFALGVLTGYLLAGATRRRR